MNIDYELVKVLSEPHLLWPFSVENHIGGELGEGCC